MASNAEIRDNWLFFRDLPTVVQAGDQALIFRNNEMQRATFEQLANGINGPQLIQTSPNDDQAVLSGAPTILDFSTVNSTTGANDFSTSGGRITVFKTGVYNISAAFVVEAVAATLSQATIAITRNADVVAASQADASILAAGNRALNTSRTVPLAAGDVVDVRLGIEQTLPGSGSAIVKIVPTFLGLAASALNHLAIVRVS